MGRMKQHESNPARQRAYRKRQQVKLERYDKMLNLLQEVMKDGHIELTMPNLGDEITKVLEDA